MSKKSSRAAYFIGIKGVGMTMLAQFLHSRGRKVSGSDVTDTFLTDQVLRRHKIPVRSPFAAANIPADAGLIVHSSAFTPENNPELSFIKSNPERFSRVPVLTYAEALADAFNRQAGIAVCGSHGKTTTTAWLGYVLWRSGLSPNVLVGSNVPQFRGSGLNGRSRYLVAEVDEYQDKMRFFFPQGIVLNNIDFDHPDFFPDRAAYRKVFRNFVKKLPPRGWLVFNADDREATAVAHSSRGRLISYSRQGRSDAKYLAADLAIRGAKQIFRLYESGRDRGVFATKLIGAHNVSNALAVIAASRQLGVSWEDIRRYLAAFRGTERRAQILGEYKGATIVDDYAHHPSEIKATLAALRARWPKDRLITVFHPHTFSRTKALFDDFAGSFAATDQLIVLDIYGSARETAAGKARVTSADLAKAIVRSNEAAGRKQAVEVVPTLDRAAKRLRIILKQGDRLVLMGAGDVFRIGAALLNKKKDS